MKLTPADEPLLTQLVAGLLASGHYTGIDPDDGEPYFRAFDFGKDWRKEDGLPQRYSCKAVEDSWYILQQIKYNLQDDDEVDAQPVKEAQQ